MKLVIIESPYAGDVEANLRYLDDCIADSLSRGEAPYASHKLYPGVLDDNIPDQRTKGMKAGFAWGAKADLVAIYVDRGISKGMKAGMMIAAENGVELEFRSLAEDRRVAVSVVRAFIEELTENVLHSQEGP